MISNRAINILCIFNKSHIPLVKLVLLHVNKKVISNGEIHRQFNPISFALLQVIGPCKGICNKATA